jgi:hypothetical protein
MAPAVGYVFGKFVHSNGVPLRDCSKAPHRKDENILYSRTSFFMESDQCDLGSYQQEIQTRAFFQSINRFC